MTLQLKVFQSQQHSYGVSLLVFFGKKKGAHPQATC